MATLGVNIDHVATLRNARGTFYPCPVEAAVLATLAGADQITVHLREDRRHITDRDVRVLREMVQVPFNLEMGCTEEMIAIALKTKPDMVTLVPEKREERTTEGGLDVRARAQDIALATKRLVDAGIPVSLFVEPDAAVLDACKASGATMVELHTGRYAETAGSLQQEELARIVRSASYAQALGLVVHAGHGLHYRNTQPIAAIPGMHDLNIGHSIVARAVLVGFERAVREMKALVAGQ
ncbi:MAG: pyridoxine 5'-phosphate synthase [Silvanigrellales bacterium]|nr:pyridoxine 5'-phosphate synthase [Silvanigrellales bacterium]